MVIYWGGFWGFCLLLTAILWLAGMHFPQDANPEPLCFIFLALAGWTPLFAAWRRTP